MRVLLVHGLGDDASAWDALSPHVRGLQVEKAVLPGFGRQPWNGETLEDVARLLSPSEPTLVVGHSMGGAIGTLMAETQTSVTGLVNVEGNLTREGCFLSGRATTAPNFDQWFSVFQRKWQNTRYGKALAACDPAAFLSYSQDLVRISEGDAIGRRYCALPVARTYIYGALSISAASLQLLVGENVYEVADAGHWVAEDAPERVGALVQDQLLAVDRPPTQAPGPPHQEHL